MSFKRLLLALAFALALCATAQAAPLSAYGGLPTAEMVEIAPDGSALAAIVSDGEQRSVRITPLGGGGQPQNYSLGSAKVRRLDWVGAQHLVITSSQTASITLLSGPRREYYRAFALDLKTRKLQPLLDKSPSLETTGSHFRDHGASSIWASMNVLAGMPEVRNVNGAPKLFLTGVTFKDSAGLLTVIQSDPRTDGQKVVAVGEADTTDFLLGPDGDPIAKTSYESDTGRWSLKLRRGAGWSEARVVQARTERPFLVGLGRDGQSVILAEQGEGGYVLREVSPDGAAGEPLDVDDADGAIFDPDTNRLIGVRGLVGDEDRYTFFDPRDQKTWAAVRAAFKGERVHLESWTRDRQKIVVLVDSPTEGPGYALVDLAARKAEWLGSRYDKVLPGDVAKVQPISFKAKDGTPLTGYLTLPNGRAPQALPLVVLPHGGPASRDTPGFDWWAQAVASRGYAVLQVNFRGSQGFGWSFTKAGFGEWGRKMQTDLSDGVSYLTAGGTVDAKRVCIVGASYGGYAALAGVALDTGVYRCAASVAGLSDLRRFVDWARIRNGVGAVRYWTRFMGAEEIRDPALSEISPAAHVDRITSPVLLVHGRDDTVVPLEQSTLMADAMKRAGKPVELVVLQGEDHWLSSGQTRRAMLTATMAFVEKNNPPN